MSDAYHLQASIDAHEKFEPSTYKDSQGRWSFATGRCLETNPLTGTEWAHLLDAGLITVQITKPGADWLRNMALYSIEVWFAKTFPWWAKLNDARQNGFLEMAYQLGITDIPRFPKLLAAAAAEDWDTAAHEVLFNSMGGPSQWLQETPVRAQWVAKLFKTGSFAV